MKANHEATEQLVQKRKKVKGNPISGDIRVQQAREKVKLKYNNYAQDSTDDASVELKEAKAELASAFNTARTEMLNEKLSQLQDTHDNAKHCKSWQIINDISNRKARTKGQIEGDTQQDRVDNWYKHFVSLLGEKPGTQDTVFVAEQVLQPGKIKTGAFTIDELAAVKKVLKTGKACGPDGIPPEVFKFCDLDEFVLFFCNKALLEGRKPSQWSTLHLIPVPKSGDLRDTNNYRGISLICIATKIYNKMLVNRTIHALSPRYTIRCCSIGSDRTSTST